MHQYEDLELDSSGNFIREYFTENYLREHTSTPAADEDADMKREPDSTNVDWDAPGGPQKVNYLENTADLAVSSSGDGQPFEADCSTASARPSGENIPEPGVDRIRHTPYTNSSKADSTATANEVNRNPDSNVTPAKTLSEPMETTPDSVDVSAPIDASQLAVKVDQVQTGNNCDDCGETNKKRKKHKTSKFHKNGKLRATCSHGSCRHKHRGDSTDSAKSA